MQRNNNIKKKIGIYTITSINYGNRLQNYALQEILTSFGNDVYTIKRYKEDKKKVFKEKILKYIKNDRYTCFLKFNDNIMDGKEIISKDFTSKNISEKYDKFVIGSDQIWNIDFDFISDIDFLPMINAENKISYAASFGISSLPNDKEKHIGEMLNDIQCIAVREQSGVEIVKNACGRDATLVLDPTLLLSSEEWNQIEKKPMMKVPEKYLIRYFLGNKEYDNYINKLVKENKLEIIDLLDKSLPIGPSEFLYLIKNAAIICTDSFHASVFSFIFEKPFIIFERKSDDADMSSRLDTFCNTFRLNHHRFKNSEYDLNKVINDDYTISKNILIEEQKKSLKYLKDALEN